MSVAAYKFEQTHRIGRAKPKREAHADDRDERQLAPVSEDLPNDEIPF